MSKSRNNAINLDVLASTISNMDVARKIALPVIKVPNIDLGSARIETALKNLKLTAPVIPDIPPIHLGLSPEILESIAQSVKSITDSFRNSLGPLVKSFAEFDQRLLEYEDQARALGGCGWTIPMQLPVTEILDLLEGIVPDSDYDGAFEDYYSAHDGRAVRELFKDVCADKYVGEWRPLLEECVGCYWEERYRIIVPSLLLVFEGALAKATNTTLKRRDPKALSASKRRTSTRGFELLAWASLEGFTADLFRDHKFSAPQPVRANRHWILHGRGSPDWDRADALRLFQAISTVPL